MANKHTGFLPQGIETPEQIELFLMRSISIPPTSIEETGTHANPSYGPIPRQGEPADTNSDPLLALGVTGSYLQDLVYPIQVRIEEPELRPQGGDELRCSIKREGIDADFVGVIPDFELWHEISYVPEGSGWTDTVLKDTAKFVKGGDGVYYCVALVHSFAHDFLDVVVFKYDPATDLYFSQHASLAGHDLGQLLNEVIDLGATPKAGIGATWVFGYLHIVVCITDDAGVTKFHTLRLYSSAALRAQPGFTPTFQVVDKNELVDANSGVLESGVSLIAHPSGTGALLALGMFKDGDTPVRSILTAFSPNLVEWSKEGMSEQNLFATLPQTKTLKRVVGVTDLIFASQDTTQAASQIGWFCTETGYVYSTTDRGESWRVHSTPAAMSHPDNKTKFRFALRKLAASPTASASGYMLWAVGDHGLIMRSLDSGETWKVCRVGYPGYPQDVFEAEAFLDGLDFSSSASYDSLTENGGIRIGVGPTEVINPFSSNFGALLGNILSCRDGWVDVTWTSVFIVVSGSPATTRVFVGGAGGWIIGTSDTTSPENPPAAGVVWRMMWRPNNLGNHTQVESSRASIRKMGLDSQDTVVVIGKDLMAASTRSLGAVSRGFELGVDFLAGGRADDNNEGEFFIVGVKTTEDSDEYVDFSLFGDSNQRLYLTSSGKIYTGNLSSILLADLKMLEAQSLVVAALNGAALSVLWVGGVDANGRGVVYVNYNVSYAAALPSAGEFVAAYLGRNASLLVVFSDGAGMGYSSRTLRSLSVEFSAVNVAYPRWHASVWNGPQIFLGFSNLVSGQLQVMAANASQPGLPDLVLVSSRKSFPKLDELEAFTTLPHADVPRMSFAENPELSYDTWAFFGTRAYFDPGKVSSSGVRPSVYVGFVQADLDTFPSSVFNARRESVWASGRLVTLAPNIASKTLAFFQALHFGAGGTVYKPLRIQYPVWLDLGLQVILPSNNAVPGDLWTISSDFLNPPRNLVEEMPSVFWRSRDYGAEALHPEVKIEWDRKAADAESVLGAGYWWNVCGAGLLRANMRFVEVYLSSMSADIPDPAEGAVTHEITEAYTTKLLDSEVDNGFGQTLVPLNVEGATQCILVDEDKEWEEDIFAPIFWQFRVTVNYVEGNPICFRVVGNTRNALILETDAGAQIQPNVRAKYSLWMDQHFWDGEGGQGEADGETLRDSLYRFARIVGLRLPEQYTAEGYYQIGTAVWGTHFSPETPEGDRDTARHHAPGFPWAPVAYDAMEKGVDGSTHIEHMGVGQKWSLELAGVPAWYQKALYAALLRNQRLREAFCIVFNRSNPATMRYVRVTGEPPAKNLGLDYSSVVIGLEEVRP